MPCAPHLYFFTHSFRLIIYDTYLLGLGERTLPDEYEFDRQFLVSQFHNIFKVYGIVLAQPAYGRERASRVG